jgi:hypothetical protein
MLKYIPSRFEKRSCPFSQAGGLGWVARPNSAHHLRVGVAATAPARMRGWYRQHVGVHSGEVEVVARRVRVLDGPDQLFTAGD